MFCIYWNIDIGWVGQVWLFGIGLDGYGSCIIFCIVVLVGYVECYGRVGICIFIVKIKCRYYIIGVEIVRCYFIIIDRIVIYIGYGQCS